MADIIASTYEIQKVLGSGGGGTVYLARHLRLDKDVVLKADKRRITTREDLLRREVNVLKNLSNPYIPQVYDFFAENDTVYTVIDYIQGESLDRPLKRGEKFSQPQVIQWACQLLEALVYLHSPTHGDPPKGYVHSDIKPANLMLRPNGDICLIDFNIALAIGEESVVGISAGYASPEHYGLDYSSVGTDETVSVRSRRRRKEQLETNAPGNFNGTEQLNAAVVDRETVDLETDRRVIRTERTGASSGTGSRLKKVIPDVRSDIYSVGATLYHLLSGVRPAKDAKEVVPLSKKEFSPPVVDIITKAMNPNPNLRYQTAEEMLEAFRQLRQNDPRVRRMKRRTRTVFAVLAVLLVAGVFSAFVGLKRIQALDFWLQQVEYSKNALAEGDTTAAIQYALQALPESKNIFTPARTAAAQEALTNAAGVYDLSGYKAFRTVELPSAPLTVELSPDGSTLACIYAFELAVYNTETCELLATLPVNNSALSEVEYLNENTVIFAGESGLTAYDISKDTTLWVGEAATAVSISSDGPRVAAVDREATAAQVYDTSNGEIVASVDFGDLSQTVTVNDIAANPHVNLFELNGDGTMLAVSFSNGGLQVFDLNDTDADLIVFESSDYKRFEGGFFAKYLAFSASGEKESVFAVLDTVEAQQTGGFSSTMPFHVQADESGIYVSTENILVKIDPESGEQEEVAYTDNDITGYCKAGEYTLVAAADDTFSFYGVNAVLLDKTEEKAGVGPMALAGPAAVVGSLDTPTVRILRRNEDPGALVMSYDPDYDHDEARLSADGKTVMLYRYDGFRIYSLEGEVVAEEEIPHAYQVYDQQFRRDGSDSWLEVTYNDGLVRNYSAADGSIRSETNIDPPDGSLDEQYITDHLRIEAPLHGAAQAFDRETGELVASLEADDYLTYVTQTGSHIITEYITTAGERYGLLLNDKCEVLARMPELCDVLPGGNLLFDDGLGNLRQSHIYSLEEILAFVNV